MKILSQPVSTAVWLSLIMAAVLLVSLGGIGSLLGELTQFLLITPLCLLSDLLRPLTPAAPLVLDRLLIPLATALTALLPRLLVLYFMLYALQDSGLLDRAARGLDRPLRAVGVGGGALLALLMGFGCGLHSRHLPISPPCAACLVLFLTVSDAAFPSCVPLAVGGVYLLTLTVTLLAGGGWQYSCAARLPSPPLIAPPLRLPRLGASLAMSVRRCGEFVRFGGSSMLSAWCILLLLTLLSPSLTPAPTPNDSLLACAARLLVPAFKPTGLDSVPIVAALITGLVAKEAAVPALLVLSEGGDPDLSPASALSFMVMFALYSPCPAVLRGMSPGRRIARRLVCFAFAFICAAALFRISDALCI